MIFKKQNKQNPKRGIKLQSVNHQLRMPGLQKNSCRTGNIQPGYEGDFLTK